VIESIDINTLRSVRDLVREKFTAAMADWDPTGRHRPRCSDALVRAWEAAERAYDEAAGETTATIGAIRRDMHWRAAQRDQRIAMETKDAGRYINLGEQLAQAGYAPDCYFVTYSEVPDKVREGVPTEVWRVLWRVADTRSGACIDCGESIGGPDDAECVTSHPLRPDNAGGYGIVRHACDCSPAYLTPHNSPHYVRSMSGVIVTVKASAEEYVRLRAEGRVYP
jgi:hypothetical protein